MAYDPDQPREQRTGRWRVDDRPDRPDTDLEEPARTDPDLAASTGPYAGRPVLEDGCDEYMRIRARALKRTHAQLRGLLGDDMDAEQTAERLVDDMIEESKATVRRDPAKAWTGAYMRRSLASVRVENELKRRSGVNVAYLRVGRQYRDRLDAWRSTHPGDTLSERVRDRVWDETAIGLFRRKADETIARGNQLDENHYPRVEVALSDGSSSDLGKNGGRRPAGAIGGWRRTFLQYDGKYNGRKLFEYAMQRVRHPVSSVDEMAERGRF